MSERGLRQTMKLIYSWTGWEVLSRTRISLINSGEASTDDPISESSTLVNAIAVRETPRKEPSWRCCSPRRPSEVLPLPPKPKTFKNVQFISMLVIGPTAALTKATWIRHQIFCSQQQTVLPLRWDSDLGGSARVASRGKVIWGEEERYAQAYWWGRGKPTAVAVSDIENSCYDLKDEWFVLWDYYNPRHAPLHLMDTRSVNVCRLLRGPTSMEESKRVTVTLGLHPRAHLQMRPKGGKSHSLKATDERKYPFTLMIPLNWLKRTHELSALRRSHPSLPLQRRRLDGLVGLRFPDRRRARIGGVHSLDRSPLACTVKMPKIPRTGSCYSL